MTPDIRDMLFVVAATEQPLLVSTTGEHKFLPPKPTLDALQEHVGGFIEPIPMPEFRDLVLYANEEGRLMGLPVNEAASILCARPIVGNAVALPRRQG